MIKPIIIILILATIIAILGYGVYYFNFLNKDNTENQKESEIIDISNDVKPENQEENSNVINTKKEDNFSIVLETNPTTGYQWEISVDSDYIQLDDRNFSSGSSEGMVGVGGKETFNFTALKLGNTEITFSYLRPWEKDVEPIEKKVYNIIIK